MGLCREAGVGGGDKAAQGAAAAALPEDAVAATSLRAAGHGRPPDGECRHPILCHPGYATHQRAKEKGLLLLASCLLAGTSYVIRSHLITAQIKY